MKGIDVPTLEQTSDERIMGLAHAQYEDCEIAIDDSDDPKRVDGGAWLAARVWVSIPPGFNSQGYSYL